MISRALQWSAVCLALLAAPWSADAAQTVALSLKLNGTDILGESTVASQDREDTIECWDFEHAVTRASARETGGEGRSLPTILIRKRIDSSTPLLLQGMATNQVAEGQFRFFRPHPGSGMTENFYSVAIEGGRVLSVAQRSLGPFLEGEAAPPMYEEVVFSYTRITYTYGTIQFTATVQQMGGARAASAWKASDLSGGPAVRAVPRLRVSPTPLRR